MKTLQSQHPTGEKQNQAFQLSFNASLKVDFQGSWVTSDGGPILVRELDERLGFGEPSHSAVVRSMIGRIDALAWRPGSRTGGDTSEIRRTRTWRSETCLWKALKRGSFPVFGFFGGAELALGRGRRSFRRKNCTSRVETWRFVIH